ncbi:MAG: histidine kinase dimerization/phospho-acceptor domain-containing protein [Elusimicrobiota bacterium]|jgi:signal transduction histidine kinase
MSRENQVFARRMAHAINNPLTGILGYCQLLLQEPGLSSFQREALEHIQAQSRRCRTLLKDISQGSAPPAPDAEKMLTSRDEKTGQDAGTA